MEVVSTYLNRKEAEYALKALTQIGGFDRDKLSIDVQNNKAGDEYSVTLKGSPSEVRQAQTFLESKSQQPDDEIKRKDPISTRTRNLIDLASDGF